MLPLVLDLARLRLVLIGEGAAAATRLRRLDEAGAADLTVYAEMPTPALARAAGARLVRRLPAVHEMAAAQLVFIADPAPVHRTDLAATARAAGVLVHVEDQPALSDAHAPAVLRRGDLTIAVSTGGKAPRLAGQVKRFLGALFGPEWSGRLDELGALRRGWREGGADPETVACWTEEWVARQGWLSADPRGSAETDLAAARSAAPGDHHAAHVSSH